MNHMKYILQKTYVYIGLFRNYFIKQLESDTIRANCVFISIGQIEIFGQTISSSYYNVSQISN